MSEIGSGQSFCSNLLPIFKENPSSILVCYYLDHAYRYHCYYYKATLPFVACLYYPDN